MVWKITFTTLGDLPWMLLHVFLLNTCVTAKLELRQWVCLCCNSPFRNHAYFNSLLTAVVCWTFANSLDPTQGRQSVWPDMYLNCLLTLWLYSRKKFSQKNDFKKKSTGDKTYEYYPVDKKLNLLTVRQKWFSGPPASVSIAPHLSFFRLK